MQQSVTKIIAQSYGKSYSFESHRLLKRRSTPKEQNKRTLRLLKEAQFTNPDDVNISKKIIASLETYMCSSDSNLIGASCEFFVRELVAEELARIPDINVPEFIIHRYRYEVFPKQQILDKYPPCVQIEPTSVCNYRCKFCFQTNDLFSGKDSAHMGSMDLDNFKYIIDSIEGKTQIVSLASRGEPTLNKSFSDMIDYCRDKFLSLKVNTNASMLNEEICHALLQGSQKTIVFSIDAGSKDLYEEIRVNGKFERIINGLSLFKDIKERYYPNSPSIVRISGVFFHGDQNMDQMVRTWGGYADQITFVKYNPWEDPYSAVQSDIVTPCSDLWRRMFIWHDLKVNPCDVDYMSTLSTGYFNKSTTLGESWHSEAYQRLRHSHLDAQRQNVLPCNKCTVV